MPFHPGAGGRYNRVCDIVFKSLDTNRFPSGERKAFDYAKERWSAYFDTELPPLQPILEALLALPDTIYEGLDPQKLQHIALWLKVRGYFNIS